MVDMSKRMMEAIEHLGALPHEIQDALADCLMQLEPGGTYRMTAAELAAIEETEDAVAREDFATEQEVQAAFARFNR